MEHAYISFVDGENFATALLRAPSDENAFVEDLKKRFTNVIICSDQTQFVAALRATWPGPKADEFEAQFAALKP
jgi:hypothetical protein